MKIVKILYLAVAATLALAACNNDDDGSDAIYYLRAQVEGDSYNSAQSSLSGAAVFGEIVLTGFETSAGKSITLNFQEDLDEGTYSYDGSVGNEVAAVYYPGGVFGTSYGDISGTFTLLEHDTAANTVKGEFNFVCVDDISADTISVTEGEFNMKYQ